MVSRNNSIKRLARVSAWTGTLKEPYEMSMALGPDCRSNFFFSPPAYLCAVTYMTEISLVVTLNSQFALPLLYSVFIIYSFRLTGGSVYSVDRVTTECDGTASTVSDIYTPLIHRAIESPTQNLDIIKTLLLNDCYLCVLNSEGLDPLQFAIKRGKFDCAKCLISHGYSWRRYGCEEQACPMTLLCDYIQKTKHYQSAVRRRECVQLVDLMLQAGYNVYADTCLAVFMDTNETTDNQLLLLMFEMVRTWKSTFRCLAYWCRLCIRNSMARNLISKNVKSLDLPLSLMKYVFVL